MPAFSGNLNANIIFPAIFNMIISQEVFADNIAGTNSALVDKARVDGSLYGDQKLYYATDALASSAWGNDAEAENLLQLHRPPAPECQTIKLDTFRQIRLTIDNYLTKQAWMNEGAFGQFNSIMLGWIRNTKRVYDSMTYNCFVGTTKSSADRGDEEIVLSTIDSDASLNTIEKNNLKAQTIAEAIANLLVDMKDVSRDFNDYGYLRSYGEEGIRFIWNSKWVNTIKKLDLPAIFHNEGLMDKFDEDVLPARFFGEVNVAATTGTAGKTVRSLIEQVINNNHYFPGDAIKTTDEAPAGTSYTVDEDVICKVYVKLPPYMSAFEVGTSFFNPRSLTENHYLTFGHNTLEYLKAYPFVTVHAD